METVVVSSSQTVVVDSNQSVTTVVSGLIGPPGAAGITNISDASDIDVSTLEAGSTLVYNNTVNKWIATRLLNQQIVECGQF